MCCFVRQADRKGANMNFDTPWCFTSTVSDWFLGQVAGVSNRITGSWNKWQPDNTLKMPTFPLTTLAGWGKKEEEKKKRIWLFFCFTDCLGDINARWDICLVSNKICLHRIWWVRLKETHPLIKKIFHVRMDFYPKRSSWTRGPEETGASEAAVYSPVRRVCRWQLALAAPLPCGFMKPANLAPRYCRHLTSNTFSQSRTGQVCWLNQKWLLPHTGALNCRLWRGLQVSQQAFGLFLCSAFMSIPDWSASGHLTTRQKLSAVRLKAAKQVFLNSFDPPSGVSIWCANLERCVFSIQKTSTSSLPVHAGIYISLTRSLTGYAWFSHIVLWLMVWKILCATLHITWGHIKRKTVWQVKPTNQYL